MSKAIKVKEYIENKINDNGGYSKCNIEIREYLETFGAEKLQSVRDYKNIKEEYKSKYIMDYGWKTANTNIIYIDLYDKAKEWDYEMNLV